MNVSLTPELEKLVAEKVRSGRYRTKSEVVSASLRLLQDSEEQEEARLAELRQMFQVGIDQLDRGEGIEYEDPRDFIAEIKARTRAYLKESRDNASEK